MAQSLLRLVSRRRLSLSLHSLKCCSYYFSSLYAARGCPTVISKPFSTAPSTASSEPPKPSSLSARLSFVFDQIDKIERERSQKDETLQRIRAWRESKNVQRASDRIGEALEFHGNGTQKETELGSPCSGRLARLESQATGGDKVELVHPWPEWIELMERLVQQNYFDHKRKDEGRMVAALGFDVGEDVKDEEELDLSRDIKTVQTACLNFGKDRFDILRSLSRKDIQILVGYGCPTADKKVVFSAKLLRKLGHIDEGDVCSSCSLRNTCERAYLLTNKEDEARTIDVMRVLLAFGFDHMHGTVTNKSVLKQKSVKTVVRKLLHEVVKLSSVPIDPNLPPPIIRKPPPKVKQPPPPPKKRVGRDDVEMKKGDWLCPKCDFMNFAKNTVCLQCDGKRPKRQLLPGEWECPECNFLNYRRNVVCFHCECKRPPDQFTEDTFLDTSPSSRTRRSEKAARRTDVSNAWNFDFDDDESDGADVAAFEYADPSIAGKDSPSGRGFKGSEEDFHRGSGFSTVRDVKYSDFEGKESRHGFDDFEDEDDDVDSYELDSRSNVTSRDFSELEQELDSDDGELDEDEALNPGRAQTRFSVNKPSTSTYRKVAHHGSEESESDFGSDEEPSGPSGWRSSHVTDSGIRSGGRGLKLRRLSYGSDDELGLDSDDDDDIGKKSRSVKNKMNNNLSGKTRGKSHLFSGSEESEDNDFSSRRSSLKGNKGGFRDKRQGSNFRGGNSRSFDKGTRLRSNNAMGSRRRNFVEDDFETGSQQGFHGGHSRERFGDQRRNRGDSRSFKGRMGDEFSGRRQHGRSRNYDEGRAGGEEFRNRRRVIER
ncbi:hypothetical protein SAY86_006059 [Trapa natans]|uniref:RanBP2-type domain-containing protein n=1 Tax=Trapa natans TaxID=22666 RepID=A0AAN7QVL5_TRANT|nr:hypothetical protein SAY86_006059 [Trapa natans]